MIDWSKEVETTEDPPRPVRVLATDATDEHPIVTLIGAGIYSWTDDGQRWRYGQHYGASFTLRNVSPPKPEPVLREAWVVWDADGTVLVFSTEVSARLHGGVYVRAAVMSDGSPAQEEDGLSWVHKANHELTAERDHWKAKTEALQAEVERMKSVVEAAVAWKNAFRLEMQPGDSKLFALFEAVGAFEAKMRETSDE